MTEALARRSAAGFPSGPAVVRLAASVVMGIALWAGTGRSLEKGPAGSTAYQQRRDIAPPVLPPGLDLTRSPDVPLADGLVIVAAITEERGDYEAVRRVSRGQDRITVSYSATLLLEGQPTEVRGNRIVLDKDLKSGRIYRVAFRVSPVGKPIGPPELARGTTALGVSTEVLEELKSEGRSECSLAYFEQTAYLISGLGLPSPEYEGFLERVEPGPVGVPVVLDGQRQWLRAIHAKGTFEGLTGDVEAEFWILDNPDNPLALRFAIGNATLLLIRIDRPAAASASRIENALAEQDRVDLPGVYFEFASARLRPESDAAISEVAGVMQRHQDWRLRIEGHTDNVGGLDFNLTLSRQRADAVKAAIVARLAGGAERLDTAGFGAGQPRESNETPEGRARNRRVEIARIR
jgi:outer membrane protein OmpA-like peptidoglycan-associated protein